MVSSSNVKSSLIWSMIDNKAGGCFRVGLAIAAATRDVSGISMSLLLIPKMVTSVLRLQKHNNTATAVIQDDDVEIAELEA